MSIAQRLVNLSDGLSADGVLSAAKGGTGNTSGVTGTSSPTISQISYGGDDTATDVAGGGLITLTGTNFASGAKVLINTTPVGVVTVVSSTQITFTAPALAAGSYILYVVNLDGSTAIAVPGIQYSGVPAWSTAAGSLGTSYETAAISSTLSATSNSAVTYSIFSGTLPSGATLNSNGTISGTSPLVSGSTTYTFTVRATDAELQDTDRQFSLTVNPDVVSWSSSNTVTLAQDTASTTTLLATSAAGQAISYATDTLPTGLTRSGSVVSGTPTVAGTTTTTATATAAVTGKTAQQTITWTVSVAADANWRYTTLLLNSENTTLPFATDASANNFAVTVVGDTKPSNFNPYTAGYYSNYWDGTGDSLVVTGNGSVVNFGTGDFTIETWFYANTLSPQFLILDTCPGGVVSPTNRIYLDVTSDGSIRYVTFQGATVLITSSAGAVKAAQWAHVALVKSNNQTKLYLNGTQVGSTYADTLNYPAQTNRPILCANGYDGGSYGTTGYLSNLRIVKGTAVYTANFTPPTQPLTAVANTSLLTCQSNRLVDLSTNAYTMTKTGDVAVSAFDPFVSNPSYSTYGSTYFDGTGDYLSVPANSAFAYGTGDFEISFWYYPISASGYLFDQRTTQPQVASTIYYDSGIITYYANGASAITGTDPSKNAWHYLTLSRVSGITRLFVDGAQLGSNYTDSNNYGTLPFSIGCRFTNITDIPYGGYISNFRVVKGSGISSQTVPNLPLTAVTNTSLLTCQTNQPHNNSQFIDNSTLGGVVTRFGNTTQGSFSPYGANWSNYFDGSGDYLSLPSAATTYLAANPFTIETWVCPITSSGIFIGRRSAVTARGFWLSYGNVTANKFSFYAGDADSVSWNVTLTSTNTFSLNQWHHVAVTRNASNVFTLWVNGVAEATVTASFTVADDSSTLYIGIADAANTPFTGYLSNLRLVQNTALYTTTFTPSTTPLTPITNTGLLTCQSPNLIDNSLTAATITKVGDTSVQKFSPFATVTQTPLTHSVYFDGTGDWLSIAYNSTMLYSTGDLTIECWFQHTAAQPANSGIFSYFNGSAYFIMHNNATSYNNLITVWIDNYSAGLRALTSTTTLVVGNWYHVAVTRASGVWRLWINGVQESTYTNSAEPTPSNSTLRIGNGNNATFTGYISNFRTVRGTAVYTAAFTPSTTPLTAISGTSLLTCQSATLVDNSTNAFALTAAGDTKPRAFNPFGYTTSNSQDYSPQTFGGSMYFDNSGDYLALPTSNTYLIGSGDFTIECWVYKRSTTFDTILSYSSSTGLRIFVNSTGGLELWVGASSQWSVGGVVSNNHWNHIAFVRTGTTLTGYVNGVNVGTATVSTNYNAGTLNIGGEGTGNPWGGYITDFRIIRGQALYTSNFVPPVTPLTATINTMLLINGDRSAIADKSGKVNLETWSSAQISTNKKKYGNASIDLSSGSLVLSSPVYFSGNTDFTIECWFNINSFGTNNMLMGWNKANYDYVLINSTGIGLNQNNTYTAGWTIPTLSTATWYHLAITRSSGICRAFINGVKQGSDVTNTADLGGNVATQIGNWYTSPTYPFNGYIDDFRISRFARYTANFTPPTSALLTK